MHLDHIRPVALGGNDEPANLRPAHADCNLRRHEPRSRRYRRFVLTLPVDLVDQALECAYREDEQLLTWIESILRTYVATRQRAWLVPQARPPVDEPRPRR